MTRYFLIKDNKVTDLGLHDSKPILSVSKGIVYEAVFTSMPVPQATEKVIESWEILEDKYVQSFEVVDKTALEMWHHPEYAMRIKVPFASINTNPQLQGFVSQLVLWWSLTKLQHEVDAENSYFYCNFIHPEHEVVVNAFGALIEIEDIPVENIIEE